MINDRFKVVALVARGGMGKVYRAEQAPLGRVCALKVLNPNYAGENDPEFHKRFFLEASIASKLTHPNTVTIFDYGRTDDDVYYIAMEYLEGRTLHRAIKEEGPFGEERAAHVARQICRALREAHSLGVIHRDLKPANVYLVEHADEADFVKVLDFGLVKNVEGNAEELTQAGLFMGSPKYMSPEQIRGDRVDARTDIYSLGIVLYEMVTGKVPFDRANSVNILMAHVNEPPPPLREMNPNCDASPQLEDVIWKCIAKDPAVRFASMDEVLAALKRTGTGALTGTMMGATGEYAQMQGSGLFGTTGSGPHTSSSGSGPQQVMSTGSGSQSGPIPTVGASGAPEKKSGKGALVAILGVAAAVAVGAFFLTRGSGTDAGTAAPPASTPAKVDPPPASTTVAPTADPAAEAAKTVAAQKIVVRVESDPSGATVRRDNRDGEELCRDTPCDLIFKGSDATPGKDIKIHVTKKGFSGESKTIHIGSEDKVSVRLSSQGGGGGVAKPPPGGGGEGTGFKPVPY
jgi:serine/threonine-protein kinase